MNLQTEQQFQRAELFLEELTYTPQTPINSKPKIHRQKSEQLSWKFERIQSHVNNNTNKTNWKHSKNISFQDDDYGDSEESFDGDDQVFSSLKDHYQDMQLVFKKKGSQGTSWIGNKQYYSSIFIDPKKLKIADLIKPPSIIETTDIVFDSCFESGNLFCAYKIGKYEYDLILQNDINTKGNTQWFNFHIKNVPKKQPIKLNIVNLRKADSLFNYGMMPAVFSEEGNRQNSQGWIRKAASVKYFKNDHHIQNSRRYYSTLSFTISTPHDNDTLRIAHCYPYTTEDLKLYLQGIEKIKYKKEIMQRQTLANTIGGNKIQVLTFSDKSKAKLTNTNKPLIIIMARQHPGETPASFICEGIIQYFLAKDKDSDYLRKNYDIKVIPMMNPDGVAVGNYRSNLYGFDLNRRWDGSKSKENNHESCYVKKYILQIAKGRQLAFVIDLHGHSRKLYSFFYGNPFSISPVEPRIFPYMCSKLAPNCIRYTDSSFVRQQFKRTTARIQLNLSFKCPNIFTYEASFFGYINRDHQKKHFTMDGYRQLGTILGKSLFLYLRGKNLFDSKIQMKDGQLYKKCYQELRNNSSLLNCGCEENSGSQSNPDQCQLGDNEDDLLKKSEDYSKDNNVTPIKKFNKKIKKELVIKDNFKATRHMEIVNLAQVNSIFPNNILALIPNSYMKKPKPTTNEKQCQTDSCPIIKIYESCKFQDNSSEIYNPDSVQLKMKDIESKSSNLIRSTIMNRPQTSGEHGLNTISVNRNKTIDRKKLSLHVIIKQKNNQRMNSCQSKVQGVAKQNMHVQTNLSFGLKSNIASQSPFKQDLINSKISNFSKEIDLKNYGEERVGKALVKNLIDNIKLRKKSNF